MTCIVGLAKAGKVYIGGDSAGVGGYMLERRKDAKVFINGKFIFGFTSSFRMGQILRYSFVAPDRKVDQDLMQYMVVDFVNAVRQCLQGSGAAKNEFGIESGGTFLVGTEGRLFSIQDDFQVAEMLDEYDSVGCGHDIAKGAMFVTRDYSDPRQRITTALEAATRHSAGVEGPYVIEEL